jgi:hypothetical protein
MGRALLREHVAQLVPCSVQLFQCASLEHGEVLAMSR